MKTSYFPSSYTAVPVGSAARSNSLGLLGNLSRTIEKTKEKLIQKVADPAHPFHLLKAIMITQPVGFTSTLAYCFSSLVVSFGHGYIAGTIEKKGQGTQGIDDTFGLVLKALNPEPEEQKTDPVSAEGLQQLTAEAIKGEIGPLTQLIELIEKDGYPPAVRAVHKVIESGEGFIKEAARDELKEVEPAELMKKALAGDSEALSAVILMFHSAKNQKARESLNSYYAELAERAALNEEREGGANEAFLKLKEAIFKDPDAISWMGKLAEEGVPAAWEALAEAMKSGPAKITGQAVSTMREIAISKLVDRVRNNLDPYAPNVRQIADILKMLVVSEVGRLAAMLELENWPNPHAEVTLYNLVYHENISGAREVHQRWRQNHRPRPAEEPLVIESTTKPKKPRRDSTEIGIPTPPRPPKPAPPRKKK